ncbi:hypothetical protein DNU06_09680 [Putridiphycobacter roseus]|uniref:SCO family protein n=1 Tax=Putridiphycobacter roseus TaxID=2219161 RepID=A0A2W1MXX0_9FLAO|nr:hypothetical protein [Putridiphycobacter roseus]PZE17009.1 hypothetical protein DNU06_09680 [Putridiphycobacter roseus]
MPGLKRLGLLILVLFGPGLLIYFFAKNLTNKFIKLPYIGAPTITANTDGTSDTIPYQIPFFEFKNEFGQTINSRTTQNQFLVFSTIQNACPDTCGIYLFHFNELFYDKIQKNKDNYNNVKLYSILTDVNGNAIEHPSKRLLETLANLNRDTSVWQILIGDPKQIFDFNYNGSNFSELPATASNFEIGEKAFVNALLLVDRTKHIRGFTGAKRDSDIRNFFDLLKILKKVQFDENNKH